MRMVDWVHSHTTSLGPAVTLRLVFMVSATSLEQGLIDTTTAGDDTNLTTGSRGDDFLCTRGQLNAGFALVMGVADDGSIGAGSAGKGAAITSRLFDVADDGTLRHRGKREDIANGQGGLLAGVDELTSVHAFGRNEHLGTELVPENKIKVE